VVARIDTSPCPAPAWLPGGNLQTLYGALAAHHHTISFVRHRVNTPDGDFIDFDWSGPGLFTDRLATGESAPGDTRLSSTGAKRWIAPGDWASLPDSRDTPALILFHGLEGSSRSHYAQSIAQHFRARGWVVVIAHFRGCSGFPNRMARAYYSGDTPDVLFMLDTVRHQLPNVRWHAVGVSLGGNAMLKALGEQAADLHWLDAAAAVSVPMDLVSCGNTLSQTRMGRQVYTRYFLKSMRAKMHEKARRFPGNIDSYRLGGSKTLRDFDDAYTAPMHGYRNALDYWTKASSKPALKTIQTPTLVLNARNDPFVPEASLPGTEEASDAVLLHQPAEGGHASFVTGPFPGHLRWLPVRLERFFELKT
jgi:predicted alpha/beta-fold hydrolase